MNSTYDYIVIGAGSAGCVLANRLTASGKYSVLLLEDGPEDKNLWIHIPLGYGKTIYNERYSRRFYTEPEPGMDNRKLFWPRGRCLGGSSSINGMISIRGQSTDYDSWADAGNVGWRWKDVLPYFIKSEHNSRGASKFHGGDGPLWSSDVRERHELMEALFNAGEEIGIPRTDDFNGESQEGCGYYQFFIHNGWRCSVATAYLRPIRQRANLHVEINSHVNSILFDGRLASGVQYERKGQVYTAKAHKEVILAAGAIQSPQLLQLSGVGSASFLKSKGIAVVHDLPGVGENLQDHVQVRPMYKIAKPITVNDSLRTLAGRIGLGLQYALFRKGALACSSTPGGMFTRVLPESKTPDIQFHFAAMSSSAEVVHSDPHKWSGSTFSICQLRPQSRGTVMVVSRNSYEAPAITANYLSAEIDRRCVVEGLKLSRKLVNARAMKDYLASEYLPGPQVQTDEELLKFARGNGDTVYHPSGTCKMGIDSMAVVDPRLRVYGLKGLRVVDCSIMPNLVSGNTNAPTVMIAEKASDMILDDATEAV